MHNGEEDGIFRFSFAFIVQAIAENEAERVSRLMPSAPSLHLIWFFSIGEISQTRLLVWVRQIDRGQAISKEFSKGAASASATRVRKIVMDIGLATGREEEKPILFDL